LSGHRDMIGTPLRPIMAGIQSTPDRITIVSTNRGRKTLIEKERKEVGRASDGFTAMEKLLVRLFSIRCSSVTLVAAGH
jgi:hypothetical protein